MRQETYRGVRLTYSCGYWVVPPRGSWPGLGMFRKRDEAEQAIDRYYEATAERSLELWEEAEREFEALRQAVRAL